MHGLGNDFMLIDAISQQFVPNAESVCKWADRRTGVGFDQLLVVETCGDEADFAFRVFNADGSESQQCGNGARCIAHFAQMKKLVDATTMRVLVGDRVMQMEVLEDNRVCVDMGVPSFVPSDVPFLCDASADRYQLTVKGQNLCVGVVSMGNPHAVLQVDELDDYPVVEVGQSLQLLKQFPESVNVGVMQVKDCRNICLRVFERGAGETMACGSGACAAVAIGRHWRVLDQMVQVTQAGGTLDIEWGEDGTRLKMTGPSTYIYDGEIDHG